jgi:peroxiredoxin
MAAQSSLVALGTPAPSFQLRSTTGEDVSLEDFAARPALLVAFICNHCPYVRHVELALARVAADYEGRGLATVGISANDVVSHPDDDPTRLADQARRAGFTFPYLYDETQEVARAYGAVCTPDLFLYDAERRLAYRGELDGTRPGGPPATGASLRAAIDHVLAGEAVPEPHRPSVGCSIKWKELP